MLGGIERTIYDADNADIGISYIPAPALHTPDSNHLLVRTSFIGQKRKIQYAYATFKANNPQGIFYRISNNDGTFTGVEWIRMYDPTILTDSTILSPLASALGATVNKVSDMAGNIPKGLFLLDGMISNAPFTQSFGTTGFYIGNNYPVMFAPVNDSNGLRIFVRTFNSSGVGGDWYTINLTKVTQ